jgi:glutamate--cysteine ligase
MVEAVKILNSLIENRSEAIEDWFLKLREKNQPFFYNSVDIRYSGDQIVPVDTNIFPAGFNNLSKKAKQQMVTEVKTFLKTSHPNAQDILIISELNTRNSYYLENVKTLEEIFLAANCKIKIGFIANDENTEHQLLTSENKKITLYKISREQDKIYVDKDFYPQLIIANNDLTSGSPEILQNIQTPIIPPTGMGWYKRQKHLHFQAYNHLAQKFAKEFDIDPALISSEFSFCKNINFKEKKGLDCIANNVAKTLKKMEEKYQRLNIKQKPYIYLKANRGTYGMGIMLLEKPDDIYQINKKDRNKMNMIKQNTQNNEILIQEGIETIDKYEENSAEPFIYLVNGNVVGNLLRVNSSKDQKSNLNSAGAKFYAIDDNPDFIDRIPSYNLVARIAAQASTIEDNFS